MKNVLVLFGKPGAGKGTRLNEFLAGREGDFYIVSVSDLLRKARREQTELGKKAESYMDAGQLVPDDIINAIVIEAIKSADRDVITDGFPRTVGQAEAMLQAGVYPTKVIDVYVEDEIVLQRARDRIVCEKCGMPYTTNDFHPPRVAGICDKCCSTLVRRKDDDEAVVKKRLKVYRTETLPVLEVLVKANVPIHRLDNTSGKTASKRFEELMLL